MREYRASNLEFRMRQIIQDSLPQVPLGARSSLPTLRSMTEEANHRLQSSTTILAIKYRGGVLTVADRRVSSGMDIFSDEAVKIYKISDYSSVALSGVLRVAYRIAKSMQTLNSSWVSQCNRELSIDGQSNFLSSLVEGWFYFSMVMGDWCVGQPIFTGYDLVFDHPRIFDVGIDGHAVEKHNYAGNGCGWPQIQGLMLKQWKSDLGFEQALDLAVEAMATSGKLSHGVSPIESALPTVSVIDVNGFKWVEAEVVSNARERLAK